MNLKFLFKYLIMTRFKFYNSSKYHLKHKKFVENKCMDNKVKGWGGRNWEIGIDMYTLLILCIKWTTEGNILYSTGSSTLLNETLWYPK